ncbi:hypothetical protein KR215_001779 [Drosophila sulfurigaster]|nr:hypothetical protein KR215_001779 [Drosophila sulfurigaster]
MSELADVQISPHITVKVHSANLGVVSFRIGRTMLLGKLKDAYCSKMHLPKEFALLYFDGIRIDDGESAASVFLDEGDLLEVCMKHQDEAGDNATQGSKEVFN